MKFLTSPIWLWMRGRRSAASSRTRRGTAGRVCAETRVDKGLEQSWGVTLGVTPCCLAHFLPHAQLLGEEVSAWGGDGSMERVVRWPRAGVCHSLSQNGPSRAGKFFTHKSKRVPNFKITLMSLTLLSLLENKNGF